MDSSPCQPMVFDHGKVRHRDPISCVVIGRAVSHVRAFHVSVYFRFSFVPAQSVLKVNAEFYLCSMWN